MCNNNKMVVVNNLKCSDKQMSGNLTFKRKDDWISEIDLRVAKQNSLILIKELAVKQEVCGSDDTPLCLILNMDRGACASVGELLARSAQLGNSCHQQPVCHKLKQCSLQ